MADSTQKRGTGKRSRVGKSASDVEGKLDLDPLGVLGEVAEGQGKDYDFDVKSAVQRYWQRFMRAENGMLKKHDLWRKLDKLNRGEQWKDKGIPPWIPKPVTNYISYVREMKRANLASAISRPTFAPMTIDDAETVYMLQRAHDHVWDHHRVDRTVREAIDTSLLLGSAIAQVYMEDTVDGKYYGKNDNRNALYQGDIKVRLRELANFFPDPDAYDIDGCKYIETTEIMPLNRVKENPRFRNFCKKQGWIDKLDAVSWSQVEMDDNADGTIYDRDNYPNQNLANIKGDEVITVHTHWERFLFKGKWRLDVTYYLRNTDFFLLRLEDVKPSHYPFAVLYDEKQRNDFWGVGTAQSIMQNQDIINKVQQTASILGTLHQNPQKIVFRESGINAQEMARTGNLPGKVWLSNVEPSQAVVQLMPPDIPKGLWELDDRTQNNIKTITGLNEAYTGQSTGSLTTSTGVNDLIERATVRDKDKMIQIDAFVERLSHLIVGQILYNWKDPRPLMTMGANGIPEFTTYKPVDKLDADNISWRVKSNIYAKAPVTQASRRQQADKLMQMQGQFQYNPPLITPEEWILMQEFDNQEEILQRMQADRVKLEQQQAQDMSQMVLQVADKLRDMEVNGEAPATIQQTALQFAQQLLQQKQQTDQQNGLPNAPQQSQGPKGVTDQVAMQNMTNGS